MSKRSSGNVIKRKRYKSIRIKAMRSSLVFVLIAVIVFMIFLMGKLAYIYKENGDEYAAKVLSQQTYSSTTLPFKRGDILDRNGNVMATSIKVYNLILDPKLILTEGKDYLEPTVNVLVDEFGYNKEDLINLIKENANKSYFVKDKKFPYEKIENLKKILNNTEKYPNVKGITLEEEYKRMYPLSTLACSTIGFTVSGNVGNWGIEESYNSYLNGTDGRKFGYVSEKNVMDPIVKEPVNGYNIVSTIDVNLQKICEEQMNSWVEQYHPKEVAIVMADPNNGEILAMCSSQNIYDLNNPRDLSRYYSEEEINAMSDEESLEKLNAIWRNYCVSDSYEAGSTIKPFTIAGALESGKITKDQTFVCDGSQTINGINIGCHKRAGHGTLNVEGAINNSCNDCLMQIAALEGIDTFCEYQSIMNFGMKSCIDLPGETSCEGLLYTKETMTAIDLATNSFGQNFNVNMMQMVAGFGSLINGGHYYKPHVVKQILNENGAVVENYNKELIRETVTKDTSDFLVNSLITTVTNGTGKTAKVAGYTVGGKTGTAQHHDKNDSNYLLSFLGFATSDGEPSVICYCIVDSPDVEDTSSSSYACRLFSAVMTNALPYLNIFPESDEAQAEKEEADKQAQEEALAAEQNNAENAGENNTEETEAATENETTESNEAENTQVNSVFDDDESYDEPAISE